MALRKSLTHTVIISVLSLIMSSNTVFADSGIYRQKATLEVPSSGMTMEQVSVEYGQARHTLPAVGDPPIIRWDYDGFTVYFEYQRVIHSVITS